MSLKAILEAIEAETQAQMAAITARAEADSQRVLAAAREEAKAIRAAARNEAMAPLAAERARLLHHARLESLQIVGSAREALIDQVLDRVCQHLADLRESPEYPQVLRALIAEAVGVLDSELEIAVDPRDAVLAGEILKELGMSASVRPELSCWGGVEARSVDGAIVIQNTLESRLEKAMPLLRQELGAFLGMEREEPILVFRETDMAHQVLEEVLHCATLRSE